MEHTGDVDESTPSVRVDIEESGASPVSGLRLGRIVVVLALIAAGFGFVLLAIGPEAGEAADGNVRQAPISTTTEAPAGVEEVDTVDSPLEVTVVTGFPNRGVGVEIVPVDLGYFAFKSNDVVIPRRTGPTPLFRSVSGERWDRVDTAVVDLGDGTTAEPGSYKALFNTGPGLGLFRASEEVPFGIDIATSSDGTDWSLVEAPVNARARRGIFGDIDGEPVVGFLRQNEVQAAIFEQAGFSADVDPICGVSFAFLTPTQIRVLGCDGSSEVLERDDVTEGDDFDEVVGCLTPLFFLGNFSGIEITFVDDPGATYESIRPLAGFPARLGDGRLVGISRAFGPVPPACDGFAAVLPEAAQETLLIWDGPGPAVEVDINNSLGDLLPSSLGTQPWAVGDAVVVVGEDAVWRIALDGTAEEIITLDSGDFRTAVAEVDGGVMLTRIVDGQLRRWTITDESVELFERELDQPITAQVMLYQDDEIAIFRDRREPQMIRWPDDA